MADRPGTSSLIPLARLLAVLALGAGVTVSAGEQVFYQSVGPSGEAVFSDEATAGALPHVVLYDSPTGTAVEAARATTAEQLEIAQTLQESRVMRDANRNEARDRLRAADEAARAAQPVYLEPERRYYPAYHRSTVRGHRFGRDGYGRRQGPDRRDRDARAASDEPLPPPVSRKHLRP